METSFTELRNKEVINVLTGKLLGNVCDIVVDFKKNIILGLVVPGSKSFFNFFKPCHEIYIPYCQICKIGEDVILVEVVETCQKKKKDQVKVFDMGESDPNEKTEEKLVSINSKQSPF
ncbi:MAG: YlmC/YmxH family sporulation protein [Clostridia bacterium]|nr:YlmC/YmxH family sporulation protein [Clostridia bacterium]